MLPLVAAFFIVLAAAAAQAITGFGYALVAIPLLTLVTEPRTAVVGAGLAGLWLSIGTLVNQRAHVTWPPALALIGAAALGMPIGLVLLRVLSEVSLRLLIAGVALLFTAIVWRGARLPKHPVVVAGAGLVAGVLSTSTGTTGPPLVAAFQAMGYEPRQFRATIAAVFCFTGVLGVVGFTVTNQLTAPAQVIGLVTAPAVALGWLAGNRVFARIDPNRFRRIVLAALVASSAAAVLRALHS